MPLRLILLGLPGAGKGTQAAKLSDHYGIKKISTGEVLRSAISSNDSLGQKVAEIVNSGMLVSDDIVNEMIRSRVLQNKDYSNGFILDGYPRTIDQAEFLDSILQDKIIAVNIKMHAGELLQRLGGRVICNDCGHTFNKVDHLVNGAICPKCNSSNYHQRDDDKESAIMKRLDVYNRQTKPLIDYYSLKNALIDVDGNQEVDAVFADIVKALNQ